MSLPQQMKALVLTAAGVELQSNRSLPLPTEDEALIEVHLAGICATDIELTRGYKGGFRGILGHEFVGTVVAAPNDERWIGQRVVGEINIGCGSCNLCRRGLGKHCRQRTALGIQGHNGAFAHYLTLPLANLHPVPAGVSDEEAVFTEPLAAAFEILEQITVGPDTRVIVQGDGRLGLLCAWVLANTGCKLIMIGRHPEKLALAMVNERVQAEIVGNELYTRLRDEPADVVVEATGSPRGFEAALGLVRPQGVLVLKSTFAEHLSQFDVSRLVVDEISLIGSRCGPFDKALEAIATHQMDVRPLINGCYSLDDGLRAFAHAREKGVLKILIDPRK